MTQVPGTQSSGRRYGEARTLAATAGIGTPDRPRPFRPRRDVSRPVSSRLAIEPPRARAAFRPNVGVVARIDRPNATKSDRRSADLPKGPVRQARHRDGIQLSFRLKYNKFRQGTKEMELFVLSVAAYYSDISGLEGEPLWDWTTPELKLGE
jgi:hypothetical protein